MQALEAVERVEQLVLHPAQPKMSLLGFHPASMWAAVGSRQAAVGVGVASMCRVDGLTAPVAGVQPVSCVSAEVTGLDDW